MKKEWDNVLDILSKTFNMDPRLCNNENYIVFALSVMKRLIKVTPKAVQSLLQLMEKVQKDVNAKSDKGTAIMLFMANTAFGIGTKGYSIANKLYEALMSMVIAYIYIKCRISKKPNLDTSSLNVRWKEMNQESWINDWVI